MSGATLQFDVSHNRTIGELRRLIMLASGSMRNKIHLMVKNTLLEGDKEPLTHFAAQGLYHGAHLTVVVSEELEASAALLLTDAELGASSRQLSAQAGQCGRAWILAIAS